MDGKVFAGLEAAILHRLAPALAALVACAEHL
jgi:hypothetical protein